MSGDFLARWSRRKTEVRRAAPASAPSCGAKEAEPLLSAEEIASLPRIDALTAESDITCFLRRGVPEALRNAALRKMWLVDPAIRDFVGPARDYAYDWNAPGGVPGGGTLSPDEVAALVQRVCGEPDPDGALCAQEDIDEKASREANVETDPGSPPGGARG